MRFDREIFLRQSGLLITASGDPVPACTPELRAEADRIVGGEILAVRSPVLWHRVGLENIDWECKACQNREWKSCQTKAIVALDHDSQSTQARSLIETAEKMMKKSRVPFTPWETR